MNPRPTMIRDSSSPAPRYNFAKFIEWPANRFADAVQRKPL